MMKLKMMLATLGAAIPFALAQPAAADDSGWRLLIDSNGNVGVDYYAHSGYGRSHAGYGNRGSHYSYSYSGGYGDHGYAGYSRGSRRDYRRGRSYDHRYRRGHAYNGGHAYNDGHAYDDGRQSGGYQSDGYQHSQSYSSCQQVYKHGYWHGRKAKIGGTQCYDRYGSPYIVQGSRYLIEYY